MNLENLHNYLSATNNELEAELSERIAGLPHTNITELQIKQILTKKSVSAIRAIGDLQKIAKYLGMVSEGERELFFAYTEMFGDNFYNNFEVEANE